MTCHGELERLKPRPHQLTWFYLLVSAGGALGGLFAAVVAPHWFTGFYEFELALLICLLVPLLVLFFEQREPNERSLTVIARWASMLMTSVAAAFAFCSLLFRLDPAFHQDLVYRARNEYGLVAIIEKNDQVIFVNGRIEHGAQHKDSKRSLEHNSYYLPGTGVEIATESFRQFLKATGEKRGLLVGVLGLGAGGMMTWSQPDDHFVFYEINPEVEKIANTFFTYLKDSPGESEVVLGDGRLQLERRAKRLATDKNNNSSLEPFDLLFMDAFASDSIPLHLLTAECFDVYCDNIKPEGILIAHISNRFVDLRPVIYQQAIDHDLTPILVNVAPLDGGRPSLWVLMTRNQKIVNSNWIQRNESPWPENMPLVRWTDDHASLAGVLDWSGGIDIEQILEQRKKK
jgi:predicted O-methyltransferase YrrM